MISSNLIKRTITAVIAAPIALWATWTGDMAFAALIWFMAVICMMEWKYMARLQPSKQRFWLFAGVIYITLAFAALFDIRQIQPDELGRNLALWTLAVVWASDIGGYIFGKLIGGPKLIPKVSPNKTWSGLAGGMIFAAATSTALLVAVEGPAMLVHAILAAFLGAVGQVGDIAISKMKRRANLKDTGNILPGHGGLLDRLDALLLVSLIAWLTLRITMPQFFEGGAV